MIELFSCNSINYATYLMQFRRLGAVALRPASTFASLTQDKVSGMAKGSRATGPGDTPPRGRGVRRWR